MNLENVYGLEQFSNYEMNQSGDLRNTMTGKILKEDVSSRYSRYILRKGSASKNITKHRIMAELWIYNPLDLPLIDHIDNNTHNNTIDNLRWCTHEENNRNRSKHHNNTSGNSNIIKVNDRGSFFWRVTFGDFYAGNLHRKMFKRDPNSDVIPVEVLQYRDEYSKRWKGDYDPLRTSAENLGICTESRLVSWN